MLYFFAELPINIVTMNERRYNDWRPETKSLIHTLRKHGLEIIRGSNGEESFAYARGVEFIDNLTACDEACLTVKTPGGRRISLYLVLGNSPGELVCDYTVHPLLDSATKEHYNRWEGRAQPTISAEEYYARIGMTPPVRA